MTDYRLMADPEPRQIARAPGSGPMIERPRPASPIAPLPTPSQTTVTKLAELKEENTLLRSTLYGLATSLHKLADSIGTDLAEAEAKARQAADDRRRFS